MDMHKVYGQERIFVARDWIITIWNILPTKALNIQVKLDLLIRTAKSGGRNQTHCEYSIMI